MDDPFEFADSLGPAKVVHVYEPQCHLKGVLVVDNVAAGPSVGGVRMAPDVTTQECFRLARAMTMKNAAAGLPHGGGKAVIYGDPKMSSDEKERLLHTKKSHRAQLAEQRSRIDQQTSIYVLRHRQLGDLEVRSGIGGILQEVAVDAVDRTLEIQREPAPVP